MDVEGAVELPDTKGISQGVYEELGVDLFFSLWFVFLNNKVTVSEEPFTILAPVNSSKTTPEALLQVRGGDCDCRARARALNI